MRTLLFFACLLLSQAFAQTAPFVWPQADSEGRLQAAFFRYETQLDALPDSARLHLFADSRYVLEVNGHFLGFGPARFYPAHPRYDSYDLSPYLRPGTNVIAVRVLSNGTYSFQLRRQPAAFWAKGFIQVGSQRLDLSAPGDWRCRLSQGLDPSGPHMSFALPALEAYDARRDPQNWDRPSFDASSWTQPVPIDRQDAWGPLQPRNIPPLTDELYRPYSLTGAYHIQPEDVWSFRVNVDDYSRKTFANSRPLLGFTYIFSPRDQQVTVSSWWGNHFLNGQGPIEQTEAPPTRPYRQLMTLDLKAGWNPFFIKRTTFWGKWDFYLGAPPEAGLVLSPNQQQDDPICFFSAGPFPPEKEAMLEDLEPFTKPKDLPKRLGVDWRGHKQRQVGINPSINNAWTEFGEPLGLRPDQVDEVEVPGESSLVYDFRYKRLGRILIDFDAPEGTVLDVGFTEDTLGNKPWMLKRAGLYMAARHIAAGGKGQLETLRPYGLRYLQVDVRGPGPVKISRVRVMQHVYPFEQTGHFACSDPAFNAIWQLGWRTLRVCAEDSYTDTPFRERGLYAGDMLPQIGVTLSGAQDWGLVRRSLELFQDMYIDQFNPGTPPHEDEIGLLEDYPLLTLEALRWYVDHTGDEAFLAALYPAYQRMIEHRLSMRDEQGLIQNRRVFIDWIQLDKSEVKSAAYHALLARCCEQMAGLAERLGKPQDRLGWLAHRAELEKSLQAHYWDESVGAFRDGIKAGKPIDHHFPISSAWPYLFDLTSETQNEQLLAHIATKVDSIGERNRHRETNPYGSFYLISALYKAGREAEAERFMRKHWTPMILEHDDTAWENFGDTGIGTLSHAWSGSPTFFLSTRVLGVDLGWPHAIDPKQVRIAPQSASLDWAEGTVPHPAGPVSVRWEVKGDQLWLDYDAPAGVAVEVAPQGRLGGLALWVNGQKR